MEEYLSDITKDMIVCLIRAGSIVIRCEIWKTFLTIRDVLCFLQCHQKPAKRNTKKAAKTDVMIVDASATMSKISVHSADEVQIQMKDLLQSRKK